MIVNYFDRFDLFENGILAAIQFPPFYFCWCCTNGARWMTFSESIRHNHISNSLINIILVPVLDFLIMLNDLLYGLRNQLWVDRNAKPLYFTTKCY